MTTKRKRDHIELAEKSQASHYLNNSNIHNIFYEPLFAAHPQKSQSGENRAKYSFLSFEQKMPFWISSMTGGDEKALSINTDLARLCSELAIGMGLGSCRAFLEEPNRREDFLVKSLMPNNCLAANLGIAQLEQYLYEDRWKEIEESLKALKADFLFIHINPIQEWLQPEGDRYQRSPYDVLEKFKRLYAGKWGVKEVGQGFGPKSLQAFVDLEVDVIEFAGSGGTNFATLERMRGHEKNQVHSLEGIGHHWSEMLEWTNQIFKTCEDKETFPEIIVSGGIRNAVEAAYIHLSADFPCLIGMGYPFLKWQQLGYETLKKEVQNFYHDYLFALEILEKKSQENY